MLSVIRDSMLNIWPAVIIWRGAGMGCAWVGLFVPLTLQEVPKATGTTSQSDCLHLHSCLHSSTAFLTPRASTKHKIILFYLPFRQPAWLRLDPLRDPHGQLTDMYTPSL